jgi:hypothetical protein
MRFTTMASADIELPMEEHDLPDRQQLPECKEPVAHEPEEHAAPNGMLLYVI